MKKLEKYIIRYFNLFLLTQPLIDLASAIGIKTVNIDISLGIIIRGIMLVICLIYLFFLNDSKYRKKTHIYLGAIFVYIILYLVNVINQSGISVLSNELKYIIKLFYFPFILLFIYNMYANNKFKMGWGTLTIIVSMYAAIIFLAQITGTQFVSYSGGKLGHVGWFYSPNEIGAVIAILSPLFICECVNNRKDIRFYLLLIIYIYSVFIIGTKVPMLGLLISIAVYIIIYIIKMFVEKESYSKILLLPLAISLLISIFIIPHTPVGQNLKLHLYWLKIDETRDLLLKENKSKLNNFIYSSRDIYLETRNTEYNQSKPIQRIMGLGGYSKEGIRKLAEIDYYDILYTNGIIGFIIYFFPYIFLLITISVNSIKRFKQIIVDEKLMGLWTSILLSLAIAYFAGHVFVAPAVSVYCALAVVDLDNKLKKGENKE
ncbi:MAG: O-antigen ligase family protein [Bacilli bacterium]|nr:O-antigen ligase family protein [Bacilli bacterium]